MTPEEFYLDVARSLGGCQLVEQTLKLYISEAFELAKECIGKKLPFRMSGDDCADYSLERLIATFQKLTDNDSLVTQLRRFKDERNFLAHNAIVRYQNPNGELEFEATDAQRRLVLIQQLADDVVGSIHVELNRVRVHLDFENLDASAPQS